MESPAYEPWATPQSANRGNAIDTSFHVELKKKKRILAVIISFLAVVFGAVIVHALVVEETLTDSIAKSGNGHVGPDYSYNKNNDLLLKIEDEHVSALKNIYGKMQEGDLNPGEVDLDSSIEEIKARMQKLKDSKINTKKIVTAPRENISRPAADFTQNHDIFNKTIRDKLKYEYKSGDKLWPYVGGSKDSDKLDKESRLYLNSLAVFPGVDDTHYHGIVGLNPDGTRWWRSSPEPPTLTKGTPEETAAMKRGGGFYLELSDHLSLDRRAKDSRNSVCSKELEGYDITAMPDTSVIITFYNEPLSTLLRSVHSVLNSSPASLLREIILVDDHSSLPSNLPGGPLDEYVKLLPKVSILRLPHRHGLVQGRLAGIKSAQGDTVTIFDSHIEVNPGWLEPLMFRLGESPKSLVFPQVPAVDSVNFDYEAYRGIGCQLTFKWVMQEQATAVADTATGDPIPSASMAGGLFSVYRDFFWQMGAYDEQMTMWGAENVEMPFRYWMCGARVECMPCSRVYHIYRNKGTGYKSPSDSVYVNRHRTAYLWTDEYYQLARKIIGKEDTDLGPIDDMLAFKEKKQCKSFKWFMDTLQLEINPKDLHDVALIGEVRNAEIQTQCLDSLSNKENGSPYGLYGCHKQGGSQAFMSLGDNKIRQTGNERMCLNNKTFTFIECKKDDKASVWTINEDEGTLATHDGTECLGISEDKKGLSLYPCSDKKLIAKWEFTHLEVDDNYQPPKHSQKWIDEHNKVKLALDSSFTQKAHN